MPHLSYCGVVGHLVSLRGGLSIPQDQPIVDRRIKYYSYEALLCGISEALYNFLSFSIL